MPRRSTSGFARSEYEWFFRESDSNKDGFLSLDELKGSLTKNGYTSQTDIKRMFRLTDINGDNKISFNEYMMAMGQEVEDHKVMEMGSLLRRIFNLFDHDGSGEIDKKEMKNVFKEMGKSMSDKEVQRLMKLVDVDDSGTLNYDEFIKAVMTAEQESAKKGKK